MAIWIETDTPVLVQGITGKTGMFHAEKMLEYNTNIVAGVTPGRGGQMVFENIPVYDTVEQAVIKAGAKASLIFVPAPFAREAIMEAADAFHLHSDEGVIVAITEGIPTNDMVVAREYVAQRPGVRLIGPNCPGIITPSSSGEEGCKMGIMPAYIHNKGRVGLVSRSGTLTYEAVAQIGSIGEGQSTCVGIGGDPIPGTSFLDCLMAFEEDPQTEAVVMIGEIGGSAEEEAAEWASKNMSKPIVGFIAGLTAPPGKRMGHAGAIISGGKGTATEKIAAMEAAGISMARTPDAISKVLKSVLDELDSN